MAETKLSHLTSEHGAERAEVNAPPVDLNAVRQAVKDDGVTYAPLHNLAAPEPSGFVPPADPIPTEEELRQKLAEALEVEAQCDELLADARNAAERAEQHVTRCHAELARFASLDDDLTSETIAALREVGQFSMPDSLIQRLGSRDIAAAGLSAARRAAEQLADDATKAQARASAATQSVEKLLCAILTSEASRLAEQHAALMQQAGAVASQLLSFNLWSASRGSVMPAAVRGVLAGYDVPMLARQHDQTAWREAADILRADPMAAVTVQPPE